MTENEAIKLLNSFYEMDEMYAAAQVAIQALEEIQSYRAIGLTPVQIYEKIGGLDVELGKYREIGTVEEITNLINFLSFDDDTSILEDLRMLVEYYAIGTPEECRVAVERMKPKKPLLDKSENEEWRRCPICKAHTIGKTKCCARCGQAFNWSE